VLFVPDRILTAICFPSHDVDNEFPHMTLMTKKWKPVNSNDVLKQTCSKDCAFNEFYEKLKKGGTIGDLDPE